VTDVGFRELSLVKVKSETGWEAVIRTGPLNDRFWAESGLAVFDGAGNNGRWLCQTIRNSSALGGGLVMLAKPQSKEY
jgi:hypothetical protein